MSSLWYSAASALFFSCWRFFRLLRARLRCRAAGVTSLGASGVSSRWELGPL